MVDVMLFKSLKSPFVSSRTWEWGGRGGGGEVTITTTDMTDISINVNFFILNCCIALL